MTTPRAAGFTILEIIATLAILAITLAGLVAANARNFESASRAAVTEDCIMLAQERLHEILLDPASFDPGDPQGDFSDRGSEYEQFEWELGDEGKVETLSVIGDQAVYLLPVRVRFPKDHKVGDETFGAVLPTLVVVGR